MTEFNPASAPLTERLQPILASLETQRQSSQRSCLIGLAWCAGAGVIGVLVALGAAASSGVSPLWALAPAVLAAAIYGAIYSAARNSYTTDFKAKVMPRLVAGFGALGYDGARGLAQSEFDMANLFERPDRFSSEDLVEGSIGATRVRLSEVHAERRETSTDSKGRTTTRYVTFFRGLLVIADFNKHLNGVTYVLPEGFTGALGGLGAGLQSLGGKISGRGELVRLEDPEFEAQFQAYSSDQIEARYVLSSSLMRRLLALKARFGCAVSASFARESLYLGIETGANWFEPPALSMPLTFESLGGVIAQLASATGVVEALDLNTRIWTKE